VLESEAEIGSSDFHAGEIACGFIEQLPEEATLMASNFSSYVKTQKAKEHIGRARGPGLLCLSTAKGRKATRSDVRTCLKTIFHVGKLPHGFCRTASKASFRDE
jgi:hypothetical protein